MKYRVVIPEEVCAILEWKDEGLPAICVVNQSLANFEPKLVFAWHLSIFITCEDIEEAGLPSKKELKVLDRFGDELDDELKARDNALFLARITWNGGRELLYRIYDPKPADDYLRDLIDRGRPPRDFDYEMKHDETWKHARFYLKHFED